MTEEMRKKFLAKLKEWEGDSDPEEAHIKADEILCEALIALGYEDIVEAWDEIPKWYS